MKYKLVPGKWCSECCFGGIEHGGILTCQREGAKNCIPGETVYKEVPTTNGDRIRAMSNEELAEEFDAYDWGCPPDSDKWPCNHPKCRQCWLDWLNKEAKEKE